MSERERKKEGDFERRSIIYFASGGEREGETFGRGRVICFISGGERRRAGKGGRTETQAERREFREFFFFFFFFYHSASFFGVEFTMPDPRNKELVTDEALRRGTSDQDSQDSKSHNSQKQKQVASDDYGGNGLDGVGSSSSGSSSQPR